MAGRLIAFEGLDQSGKQTQAEWLAEALRAAGHRVQTLSFPDYQTTIGAEIGAALQGRRGLRRPTSCSCSTSPTATSTRRRSAPGSPTGQMVVADRYAASSLAYGDAQGLDVDWLTEVQRLLPAADLTLLLDIAPGTSLERKRASRDRFEQDLPLLSRVRESYRRQAAAPTWHLVDGAQPAEAVRAAVSAAVRSRLGLP